MGSSLTSGEEPSPPPPHPPPGKDLHWYARDKKTTAQDAENLREEVRRLKEEEEQLLNETLGLGGGGGRRAQPRGGSRLDSREKEELFKRGKAVEELTGEYKEGERVQGLGFAP